MEVYWPLRQLDMSMMDFFGVRWNVLVFIKLWSRIIVLICIIIFTLHYSNEIYEIWKFFPYFLKLSMSNSTFGFSLKIFMDHTSCLDVSGEYFLKATVLCHVWQFCEVDIWKMLIKDRYMQNTGSVEDQKKSSRPRSVRCYEGIASVVQCRWAIFNIDITTFLDHDADAEELRICQAAAADRSLAWRFLFRMQYVLLL